MLKPIIVAFLMFYLPVSGSFNIFSDSSQFGVKRDTGTLEKLAVSNGSVKMNFDLNLLNGTPTRSRESKRTELNFDVEQNSLFSILVFQNELRSPLPSAMPLIPRDSAALPAKMNSAYKNLVVEKAPWDQSVGLVVRDGKSGFIFFNIEGHQFSYEPNERLFGIENGRLRISEQFATEMGRSEDKGMYVGDISITATMRQIEVSQIVNGVTKSDSLPASSDPLDGTVPGPDVIVGDVYGLAQFGSNGTQVGLAVGTNSCNFGTEDLNWFALPSNDHPVIPQNLYRMSGGASNDERFEQIGQSNVKHAFTALTGNLCGLGCNGVGGSRLGSGCSDPYSAGLNAGPNLGSKAWINPFDGAFPRGDSGTSPNTHSGHSHNGTSHRILTEMDDLRTNLNPGARYFAEGQYVTPHEYQWCQSNPGECNMYNNVSYREYDVTGTASPFGFSSAGSTVRTKSAIAAWPGATFVEIEPDPGNDGIGTVAYKVTNTAPGVWHYEYAVYNQNIDRAIQSFGVPLGAETTLTNIGFHAPPQHPGSANDGTLGGAGFSSTPWGETQTANSMTWNTETFAVNENANAIRWATMYNFRFDSNSPPSTVNATIGFFKTGAPITVQVQGPGAPSAAAVSVSGRVTTAFGRAVPRAYVQATILGGGVFAATTNGFGYYRLVGLTAGEAYTITVDSKSYEFASQSMEIDSNLTGVDFVAE